MMNYYDNPVTNVGQNLDANIATPKHRTINVH